MTNLIVSEFVSLNGVMETRGGEGAHRHSRWTFKSNYGKDGSGVEHLIYERAED